MKIVWLPLAREWAVVIESENVEVARFSTLWQAEEWWLAEGHSLYASTPRDCDPGMLGAS